MPPKCRFIRSEIVEAALSIARVEGASAVTARAVAARLHATPKVIFGLFSGMEELQQELLSAANAVYQNYLEQDMAKGEYPPYKASGMSYIRFAMEERELFRLLFMRDRSREEPPKDAEELRPILELIQQSTGLSEEKALLFHLEMWMYVHGIATTLVTSYADWDLSLISQTLTDVYQGLKYRHCGKEPGHECH